MTKDQNRRAGGATSRSSRRNGSADPLELGLRKLWAAMEHEPVPDSFLDLLDEIDAKLSLQVDIADTTSSRTDDRRHHR